MRTDRPRFAWPEELVALLGKVPDSEIARKAGLSTATVALERRQRQIEPFQKQRSDVEWTPEMIALLGTDTDAELARRLGIPAASVTYKRTVLGIPACLNRRTRRAVVWAPEDQALLGKVFDREVAEQMGVSLQTAQLKRRSLGISPCGPSPAHIDWTEEMIELVGKVPVREFARRYRISPMAVTHKRRALGIPSPGMPGLIVRTPELAELAALPVSIAVQRTGLARNTIWSLRKELGIRALSYNDLLWAPETIGRLGREADLRIAKDLGMAPQTVTAKRESLGIAPFHRFWRPEEIALLGTAPDEEIAERLGRTTGAVRQRRSQLGKKRVPGRLRRARTGR